MNEISSHDEINDNINNDQISEQIINTIHEDMEHFCLVRMTNNSQMITQNISNDVNNSQIFRKDAKGVKIIKRDGQNTTINHHAYFIDDLNKDKKLAEIVDMESFKNYNKKSTFSPEFDGDGNFYYNTKVVQNECCCMIT